MDPRSYGSFFGLKHGGPIVVQQCALSNRFILNYFDLNMAVTNLSKVEMLQLLARPPHPNGRKNVKQLSEVKLTYKKSSEEMMSIPCVSESITPKLVDFLTLQLVLSAFKIR